MKIVDCFTFYNELELLYYRFSILYDIVDYFVLVESTRTFSGNPKLLYYQENKEVFSKFADKIIHVVDNGLVENTKDPWSNEYHQRNYIDYGLKQLVLKPKDKIIISDIDEIPDPDFLKKLKQTQQPEFDVCALEQDFYYYNLKCKHHRKWDLAKIVSYDFYSSITPQKCRSNFENQIKISPGGWHLSYFGDAKYIRNKIEQFSHQEYNQDKYKQEDIITSNIKNGKDLYFREGEGESMIQIPISQNNYLPPQYDIYLTKFL